MRKCKFRVVHDLPILDIAAVTLSIVTLLVTVLIAMGMVGVHRRNLKLHETLQEETEENKKEVRPLVIHIYRCETSK